MKVLISTLFNECVELPDTDDGWIAEYKGFIENYEFPCVRAWDGFHVHVSTKLKNYYSFKNRYTIIRMGLVGQKIPNKTISLGDDRGGAPKFTIGDSAFPCFEWLRKGFNVQTRDPKERLFNKKLCSARVVTENAYGMLKGKW